MFLLLKLTNLIRSTLNYVSEHATLPSSSQNIYNAQNQKVTHTHPERQTYKKSSTRTQKVLTTVCLVLMVFTFCIWLCENLMGNRLDYHWHSPSCAPIFSHSTDKTYITTIQMDIVICLLCMCFFFHFLSLMLHSHRHIFFSNISFHTFFNIWAMLLWSSLCSLHSILHCVSRFSVEYLHFKSRFSYLFILCVCMPVRMCLCLKQCVSHLTEFIANSIEIFTSIIL